MSDLHLVCDECGEMKYACTCGVPAGSASDKIEPTVRQLENELRYCLSVIDDNLDVKHDLRIEYARTLLPNAKVSSGD